MQQLKTHSRAGYPGLTGDLEFSVRALRTFTESDPVSSHSCRLAQLIESSIVPQLVVSQNHDLAVKRNVRPIVSPINDQAINDLVDLALRDDPAEAVAFVLKLHTRGVNVDSLYLDLLAPAARRLGERWEIDLIDFTAVTFATWRLQHILRALSTEFRHEDVAIDKGYRTLIMTAPGEQHSFGLAMLSEFFRNGGWTVCGGPGVRIEDAARLVHDGWFDMIGFSLSTEAGLEELARGIERLKRISRNKSVLVLVGGRVFNEKPELASLVGGSIAGIDARDAVIEATHLIDLKK